VRLKGEVAVITGSTRGIGAAMAQKFAREGASVIVSGRTKEPGLALVDAIEAAGGQAAFVGCDVGLEDEVRHLVEAAVERFGTLTVLVNNAPPRETGLLDLVDLSTDAWEESLRTGVTSAFWAIKYAVPRMVESGHGSIINVSSGASKVGMGGRCAYTAAKGALNALTRCVAVEYGKRGVRCNTLVLGFVVAPELLAMESGPAAMIGAMAERTQITRIGMPDDVAHFATYLASIESEYVTGAEFDLDGGQRAKGMDLRELGGIKKPEQ
jgi:NAD(P)-dependent dehydrogenase (short-subunit alcohol dehydrogenase family)